MHEDLIKVGEVYSLIKVWIKKGRDSKIKLGVRKITLASIPRVGRPIMASRPSEHGLSGDPKNTTIPVSTNIQHVHKIKNVGMSIETETSILMLVKKDIEIKS